MSKYTRLPKEIEQQIIKAIDKHGNSRALHNTIKQRFACSQTQIALANTLGRNSAYDLPAKKQMTTSKRRNKLK